jgi:hypothetical protein
MANCKKTCSCGADLNFGVKATSDFGAITKIAITDYENSDSVVNYLDLSATWDKAFWDGIKSDADFTKRFQFSPSIDEVNPSAEDAVTVTRQSGRILKIRDGIVTYEFLFDAVDGTFYNALKSRECRDNGVILFDDCGKIAGKECEDGKLNVAQIAPDSMDVQYIPATGDDRARIRLRFNLDLSESPVFDIVEDSDIEYSPLLVKSLYDGEAAEAATVATTAQLVVKLQPVSSFASKKYIPLEGADTPANWTITDSTGATSNPTGVTESPAGTYTLDYVAIAAGVTTFDYLDTTWDITVVETVA